MEQHGLGEEDHKKCEDALEAVTENCKDVIALEDQKDAMVLEGLRETIDGLRGDLAVVVGERERLERALWLACGGVYDLQKKFLKGAGDGGNTNKT